MQRPRLRIFLGARRNWRPRSSWKLLSSHPACWAIQAVKEPSELLNRAEERWEFLSQWKLLEHINFYYHFVFSTVYSHELVCTRLGGAYFCIPALEGIKGMLLLLFLFPELLEVFFFFYKYVWKWCWSLKQGDGTDASCGCVSGLPVCVYDQWLSVYSVLKEMDPVELLLDFFFFSQNSKSIRSSCVIEFYLQCWRVICCWRLDKSCQSSA